VLFQLVLAASIAWLGSTDPSSSIRIVVAAALATAALSASLDIVTDAYRTDILSADERGRGTAAYVTGYRVALILSGSGALLLSDVIGWRATYYVLAGVIALGPIAALLAPAVTGASPPQSLRESVVEPLRELFTRPRIVWILAIVCLYRVGDSLVSHIVTPFLLDIEFTNTEVGLVQKGFGMAATIVGVWIGGIVSDRIGLWRTLFWFGIAQALANVGYVTLATFEPTIAHMAAAVFVDNLCNGLGTAAFVALLMSLCATRFSATQYALLTSASTLVGRLLSGGVGVMQAQVGWVAVFASTIVLAAPALLLIRAHRPS